MDSAFEAFTTPDLEAAFTSVLGATIKEIEPDIIALRRDIHEHPELSFQEFETTKKIADEVRKLGLEPVLTEPTGLYADLVGGAEGAENGPCIALRADMDALEVTEKTGVSYCSTNDGVMHACGHDNHTAMLYGAMRVLVKHKDLLKGKVRFIFQPAEEIAAGAKKMIEQGVLDGVDAAFGTHVFSFMPLGAVEAVSGPRYAAADIVHVRFYGASTHGAIPHMGVDATMMAAQFTVDVQTVVSRFIDPQHPAVITVGRLVSGTKFNIVSGYAEADITVRTFYHEDRELCREKITSFAESIAAAFGGRAEVDYKHGTDIVNNHVDMTGLARSIASELLGEDCLVEQAATMGGEDFGAFSDIVPGVFCNIGSGFEDDELNFPNHNEKFNVDERVLALGATFYAEFARQYLENPPARRA